jgi:hypothetical protein
MELFLKISAAGICAGNGGAKSKKGESPRGAAGSTGGIYVRAMKAQPHLGNETLNSGANSSEAAWRVLALALVSAPG